MEGKNNFVFLFISSKSRKIIAYHIEKSRDTLPAVIAMQEAIRIASLREEIILVTDGNPLLSSRDPFYQPELGA